MAKEYALTQFPNIVQRLADGMFIHENVNDSNWVAYQEWLAAGNTPAPAENVEAFDPRWDWGLKFVDVLGNETTGA